MRSLALKKQFHIATAAGLIAIVLFFLLPGSANTTGHHNLSWDSDLAKAEIGEPSIGDTPKEKEETEQTTHGDSSLPLPVWISITLALTFSFLLLSASLGYIWRRSR